MQTRGELSGWNMAPQLFVRLCGIFVQAEGKAVHFETLRDTPIIFKVPMLFSICFQVYVLF